ncbi:LacI family DNA-binding transcriptional regulator [Neorhizobium sp. Rsf11]|uniref:LacI family DNA-binding transcriptional regulator n=2 Tax=Neorhizobium TaxID=1525371 RepID=A0ABV0M854_9HYPH|nr:LacI family DNA-binding transcriptional regulator [Neorhizobium petrolearium]MCC2611871.1 LacI family DNA-binding transcriptional regulator [Neorhizobium petrolearium]WGI67036.1 LacI family DNA-binding transcriptional regulator [Neorhizobium petrolearium]
MNNTTSEKVRRKPMTARELARMIGVSQSAISRAFTPGASIAPQLRAKILRHAEDVGYHPNAIASMLSKSRTNIVGIVISDMQNPFYPALIERLSRGLQRVGLQSLMFNITKGADLEEQLSALRRYNVDAVIIISATILSGPTLRWATEDRAAILINRVAEDAELSCVICDNIEGARTIADHFHEIGRRRIAYVAGLSHTTTNRERQSAFITRIAEHGMTLSALIDGGEYSYYAGRNAALDILARGDTDAIFFANDILAVGGIDALQENGVRVPEDIAVAGFDDIAMAGWPHYSLTTFRQPIDTLVDVTVTMLEDGSCVPGKLPTIRRISGELIKRRSTMGAASPD